MSDAFKASSQRPYLLRAMHEWMTDNGMTPHLLVDARKSGVHVPPHTIKDDHVVLNIAERAVHMLSLGNEYITFNARFSGVSHEVCVPMVAVVAIYSRETGQGMTLPPDGPEPEKEPAESALAETPLPAGTASGDDDDTPPPAPPAGRGHLRLVK